VVTSPYLSVLLGGLIGSGSTLAGTIVSHRLTRERDRRAVALQGLRELAVVRFRTQRREEVELEADLATIQYQWTMAGVAPAVIAAYLNVARHVAQSARAGEISNECLQILSGMDDLARDELMRPARGRARFKRERIATTLAESASSHIKAPDPTDPTAGSAPETAR